MLPLFQETILSQVSYVKVPRIEEAFDSRNLLPSTSLDPLILFQVFAPILVVCLLPTLESLEVTIVPATVPITMLLVESGRDLLLLTSRQQYRHIERFKDGQIDRQTERGINTQIYRYTDTKKFSFMLLLLQPQLTIRSRVKMENLHVIQFSRQIV